MHGDLLNSWEKAQNKQTKRRKLQPGRSLLFARVKCKQKTEDCFKIGRHNLSHFCHIHLSLCLRRF
ncbi:hypothetical protein CPter291_0811 [Collimonas pratensis]|uniref:Uncharacterized protein n=1 Tax=Collimonas pratensis TaxID=279113 RepID=A0ABN4M6F4_9BURK|nr:hypothetical protein CPter291_0811 [Collimonas pratensis]